MSIRSYISQRLTRKHSPKYSCLLLLTHTVCTQLDATPQEIIPTERQKIQNHLQKRLSTCLLSSCAEHWKVWKEINVHYTGIYILHPDNRLKFQAWGQNWSFVKLIFVMYSVSNHNTFNCFHSLQSTGRAPVKNQELKNSFAVYWNYKYWRRSCKPLAYTEHQCERNYNWPP